MREGNEDNKPHLCVATLDGNAHVIPTEVFDKIISGEMKITDMDDWEIITRTVFSEWLRGLETAAKTRRELPKLIEVEYQGITPKGSLRHPRFVCVREDKVEHD